MIFKEYKDFFGTSVYLSGPSGCDYPYIRKRFEIKKEVKKATLYFSALGFAEIYMNGKKITENKFITPHTMYNKQQPNEFIINPNAFDDAYFTDELGYSIAVNEFDVTPLINEGANAFGVILSGGWYMPGYDCMYFNYRNFGRPKTAFRILLEFADGSTADITNEGGCTSYESFIIRGSVFREQVDERREIADFSNPDFDDTYWHRCIVGEQPTNSKFYLNECPPDKIIKYLVPKLIKETATEKIYALSENTVGYPIIKTENSVNDEIKIVYGEEITEDNDLEVYHTYKQYSTATTDGRKEHHVRFTWYGFRYFSVSTTGDLKGVSCDRVAVIHADVKNTSEFWCNLSEVNYLYDAYVLTQLENYHCGLPCDCPQIEKRGYTGDGQLIMPLGISLFDSKKFYEKWLNDISDVQDRKTGFVHNTAPVYVSCAGGPGGWSVAIINAPYFFYKQFGEKEVLERFYPQMLKFVEFIDDESVDSLVTIHKRKAHCLGDWSGPYKPYLPEPFANTCMIIEAFNRLVEVAKILGHEEEIARINALIEKFRKGVDAKYFDATTGDYCGNEQGSNAFAIIAGLGDERTLTNLKNHYAEYKGFDTGIFGTKYLPQVLFENDFGDVAMGLYTSDNEASFKKWMEMGETTLRESWLTTRSHSHPMFGAPVMWLFGYVLGIRQKEGSVAYDKVIINPKKVNALTDVSGSLLTPKGRIKVDYTKKGDKTEFTVIIPANVDCEFSYDGKAVSLKEGENKFVI